MNAWHLFEGQVYLPDGRAAEGAYVSIGQSSMPLPETAQKTNGEGAFKLMLPEGEFTLRVFADDGRLSANAVVQVPLMKRASFPLKHARS